MSRTWTRLKDAALDKWDALRGNGQQVIQGQTRVVEEEEDGQDYDREEVAEGYQPHLASPEYHKSVYEQYGVQETAGNHEKMQDALTYIAEYVGAIGIWLYLGYSQAQVFTGFRFPAWDFNVLMFGTFAFVVELIGLVLLFRAAKNFNAGKYGECVARFSGFLLVAASGFFSQLLLLNSELVRHILSFPDSALVGLPVNQGFVFFWRSLLPAAIQVYLVFMVVERKYDTDKAIEERRKHQENIHRLEREDAEALQRKIANDSVIAILSAGSEAAQQMAKVMTAGQRNIVQQMTPKLIVQQFSEPEQIPERTLSAQQATSMRQQQSQMPLQRPETVNRPPAPNKAQNVPPAQKNVRIEAQHVTGAMPQNPLTAPAQPEVEPAPLPAFSDKQKLQAMVRILQQNPDVTMATIVQGTAVSYGGVVEARRWYMEAKAYLEEEELPKAANDSGVQQVPIIQNPRDRFRVVEDAEDGAAGEEEAEEPDRPFV